jgi:hypothetical protein
MFVEVAEKAVKEDKEVGENSLLSRVLATNIDHYKLCPFRSLNVDDCPLCKIGK